METWKKALIALGVLVAVGGAGLLGMRVIQLRIEAQAQQSASEDEALPRPQTGDLEIVAPGEESSEAEAPKGEEGDPGYKPNGAQSPDGYEPEKTELENRRLTDKDISALTLPPDLPENVNEKAFRQQVLTYLNSKGVDGVKSSKITDTDEAVTAADSEYPNIKTIKWIYEVTSRQGNSYVFEVDYMDINNGTISVGDKVDEQREEARPSGNAAQQQEPAQTEPQADGLPASISLEDAANLKKALGAACASGLPISLDYALDQMQLRSVTAMTYVDSESIKVDGNETSFILTLSGGERLSVSFDASGERFTFDMV